MNYLVDVMVHLGLASDPAGELHVAGVDRDSARVAGAQIRVLEQPDHVGLGGLLKREECLRMELEARTHIPADLSYYLTKGYPSNAEIGPLLVSPDLAQAQLVGSIFLGLPHSIWSYSRILFDETKLKRRFAFVRFGFFLHIFLFYRSGFDRSRLAIGRLAW